MVGIGKPKIVVHPARDMAAGVAAWTAVLGHGPVWEGPNFATFQADGVEIGLSQLPWFDVPLVFWEVADIESAWTELTAAGATAMGEVEDGSMAPIGEADVATGDPKTGIVTMPHRRLAVVRASDGSLVGLAQDLPASQ
jgi:catechol 2,3-dioxygenase-like lactoylglutathione lyase family enzyme